MDRNVVFLVDLEEELRNIEGSLESEFSDSSSSAESDADDLDSEDYEEPLRRRQRLAALRPFYEQRVDIFAIFDPERVRRTFRFNQASILYITGLIEKDLLRKSVCNRRLLPLHQVLAALHFYSSGTFQSICGNVLKMSQSSVCRAVFAVSIALCRISRQHINFPVNLTQVKRGFKSMAKMPGIVGAIDGTHCAITGTDDDDEQVYVNRKGYHSINVQAICDSNGRFQSVFAAKPGSVHDSTVFKESAIGKSLKRGRFGEGFLVGDSGYANTPYLITPYPHPSTRREMKFNNAHKSTRCVIERSFGMLKRRFHVLHGELRMRPARCCRVILACFVLHNIAKARNEPDFIDEEFEDDVGNEIRDDEEPQGAGRATEETMLRRAGTRKRDLLAALHFGP